MSGQRRALALAVLVCSIALSGCASSDGPGLSCEQLPVDAQLTMGEDGGFVLVLADGTTAGIGFANGGCVVRQAVTIERPERSEADLIFLYDYYRLRLAPCLDTYGFHYLAPPTREAFVESGGNWSPYDSLFTGLMDGPEILALTQACPELPPKVFDTR
jgi:hypothetical protein